MTDEARIFSANLDYYLRKEGLQQKELAKMIGVSSSTVSAWVQGVACPRMDKVQLISDALHCSKADLITPPVERRPKEVSSADEKLLAAFHAAPADIQFAVVAMLNRFTGKER